MKELPTINKGDFVTYTYRYDATLKCKGYVVSVLNNTIVVDISEDIMSKGCEEIEPRQVVKHGNYNKLNTYTNK